MSDDLKKLKDRSERVALVHAAHAESRDLLQEAKQKILFEVREILRPALPAICDKIPGHEARGALAAINGLYLCDDGEWRLNSKIGLEWLGDADVVREGFKIEEIVEKLDCILRAQISGRQRASEELASKAIRLHAIAVLLRRE